MENQLMEVYCLYLRTGKKTLTQNYHGYYEDHHHDITRAALSLLAPAQGNLHVSSRRVGGGKRGEVGGGGGGQKER